MQLPAEPAAGRTRFDEDADAVLRSARRAYRCALKAAAPRGGIAVTIAYPASPGANFDWDYYLNKHVPMVSKLFGAAVREVSIDKGLAGGGKDVPPPFVAIATMRFDSIEAFETSDSGQLSHFRRRRSGGGTRQTWCRSPLRSRMRSCLDAQRRSDARLKDRSLNLSSSS